MAKSRARKLADLIVTAGVDIDGNLTFDGGSTSADLTFADGDKANFGDASDLQIYHSGSESWIKDSGSGSLYIDSDGPSVQLTSANSAKNMVQAIKDGAVNLFYDNSKKFETTSTGATVTGQLTASTNLIATTATYSPIVYGGSSNLQLKSNTAEMFAQFTNNGAAELYYDNSKKFETVSGGVNITGQTTTDTVRIDSNTGLAIGTDPTSFGSGVSTVLLQGTSSTNGRAGALWFKEYDGTDTAALYVTDGNDGYGTVLGAYQGDLKFGIGGIGSSNIALTIDTNKNVGIGTDTPGRALEISTDGTAQFRLSRVDSTINGNNTLGSIEFWGTDDTSGTIGATIVAHAASTWGGGAYPTDLRFSTTETSTLSERMRITRLGDVSIGSDHGGFSGWKVLNIRQNSTGGMLNFEEDDGTRAFTFANQGVGMRYQAHIAGGYHRFETDALGAGTAMMITDAGNIGIGTTSPSYKLDVYDSTAATNIISARNDSQQIAMGVNNAAGGAFLFVDTAHALRFGTSGSERMRITDTGYFRLNHNNAWDTLGTFTIVQKADNHGIGIIDDASQNTLQLRNNGTYAEFYYNVYNPIIFSQGTGGGDERMRIDSSGNVGIGTTSPGYKLHVNANHGDVAYISSSDPDGGPITNGRVLHIRDNYATSSLDSYITTGWTSSPGQDVYIGKRTTSGAGYLAIKNSNGTEHFTIDMVNGHVGINKTSGFTDGGFSSPRLVIKQTANSAWGGINIESSADDSILALGATDTAHYIASSYRVSGGYKPIAFLTGGVERARIDTSGNVGIGVSSIPSWANLMTNGTVAVGGVLYIKDSQKIQGLTGFPGAASQLILNPDGGAVRIGDTDGIYNSNATSYVPFNTSGKFVTISNDNGAFLNLQSESTGSEQIGAILWTNRTGASDAHRQIASIDVVTVDTTNSFEGGTMRFYTKIAGSANTAPAMLIQHNSIVKTSNSEFLGFEDAIDILNADPEDGGADFDQTPTNLSDGGGTTWSISNDGDAIYFSSTSGGHGGTWMHVYCDAGLWAIKGSVRLTNTDGAVHGSTSPANYVYTHSFRFYIDSGPDSGTLKWDADTAASTTGTDFTRAAFSGTPVYMGSGYKTIKYQTNGYNGVQQIYITDLQLVKVG